MHNTDVAGFVPATIQMTPAPMMPREMRYASTVSIMASLPRRCFCPSPSERPARSSRPQATLPMWPSMSRSVIAAGPKLTLSPGGYDVASSTDRARPPTPAEPERVAPASASQSGPDPRVWCTRTALATAPFLFFRDRERISSSAAAARRGRRRPWAASEGALPPMPSGKPRHERSHQNHRPDAGEPALWRQNPYWRRMPPAVRGKKAPPPARRRSGVGRAKANQNARKHGLFTRDAIAERRQIRAVLGDARKLLEEMK